MFGNVSAWFQGTDVIESNTSEGKVEKSDTTVVTLNESNNSDVNNATTSSDLEQQTPPGIQEQLDEVSEKAYEAAKDWGGYFYGLGKAATETVSKTAIQLKDKVEEKTFLGDFQREQKKFVTDNKKHTDSALPPWVGLAEEEDIKDKILQLSSDKRNFMRNPPPGMQFNFDFDTSYPVAMGLLQEDPKLKAMRFELVPKQINENTFWRNYFYRVSLITQSAQLSTLAQETGSTGEKSSGSSRRSSIDSNKDKPSSSPRSRKRSESGCDLGSSPPDQEFVSDAFSGAQIDQEALQRDMQLLGVNSDNKTAENDTTTSNKQGDMADWERELQAELQDFEVVAGDAQTVDDDDLERELLQQIEAEAQQ